MSSDEKSQLVTAIATIADPKGNWSYGWRMLCELAGMDPQRFAPPFKNPESTIVTIPGKNPPPDSECA